MQINVSNGMSGSGARATLEVNPAATPIDVLNALFEAKLFGVDPVDHRYVIVATKTQKTIPPQATLQSVGVGPGDDLVVSSDDEQGY
jgi:hypothetical protein